MAIADTTFGFVGCGTISTAVARGLCTLDTPPKAVFVSPRNAEKAAALLADFPGLVKVAASNQEVVDNATMVYLGLGSPSRPTAAEDAIRELKFNENHTVVSLLSTASLESLKDWCSAGGAAPKEIVRAIPLPPVAHHAGACIITPKHPLTMAVFEALGSSVAVDTEAEMMKMMPITCMMGQVYAQQQAAQKWLLEQGIEAAAAAKWVGAIYHTVTFDAKDASEGTFDKLVAEQTPGGLNEQVLSEMDAGGAWNTLQSALDGCLARIEGKERPAKRQCVAAAAEGGD